MGYSAYVIEDQSRLILLERFPPKFSEIIAHHVTFCFPDRAPPPPCNQVTVVGYALSEHLECIVVEVNGFTERPSGGVFHVTLSLDRRAGAKPVHSNQLLKTGWQSVDKFTLRVYAAFIGNYGVKSRPSK